MPLRRSSSGRMRLDQPLVVGRAERRLDVVLRMHAEREHRRREHDLIVEAERVHRAPRQLDEMMGALLLDLLQQRLLMRDAAVDVLIEDAGLAVEQRTLPVPGRAAMA